MRPYEELIVDIPNYPKPGVVFKDLTPAFADADAFAAMVDDLGAAVALRLGAGFVPCRKPGKLPRTVLRESYALEYGTDVLEIHADALISDDVVLIVDDLVATGGTTTAMVRLVRASGARLAGLGFVMELAFLNPRAAIAAETDAEVFSLVAVE